MKSSIFLVFLFLSLSLFAQQKPDFYPEQLQEFGALEFCQSGKACRTKIRLAEFSYNILGRGEFESENNTILTEPFTDITSRRELFLQFRVPLINKSGLKILAGYSYKNEVYKIKTIGSEFQETIQYLNNLNLRTVRFDARVSKSINSQSYIMGTFAQGFNGDLDGLFDLQNKFSNIQASLLYGRIFKDDIEAGIGVVFSQDFIDNQWLPILMYNHNFAPQWGIEAVLPLSIYLKSYRDEKTIVSIGAEYSGNVFNIAYSNFLDQFQQYTFDHAALSGTIMIEKQIAPWIWFYSKIGFQTNFASSFISLNENTIPFEVDQTDTPFFKLSLFISPPDSFFK